MFLTQEPHNIEDFLKSVNFVAPQGMDLQYFIVPFNKNNATLDCLATDAGFKKEQELNIPGVTDTITYTRRQALDRNSMASANFNPNAAPAPYPTHQMQELPMTDVMLHGGKVNSPVRGILMIANNPNNATMLVKESIGVFPRNTLLHFIREA